MKNIRMCKYEIENYFNENGKLNIKVKWEKDNKGFVLTCVGCLLSYFGLFHYLVGYLKKYANSLV